MNLRKACRNCTASKRKCIVQLPQCSRCIQRGLECIYDLEPMVHGEPERLPRLSFNPSNCDSPGYCIMKTLKFRPCYIDPSVCAPGHEDAMEIIRMAYQPVLGLVRAGTPAVFVHPKLHSYSENRYFSDLGQTAPNHGSLECLIRLDVKTIPVQEALVALQALLIYFANMFFYTGEAAQSNTVELLDILLGWTYALLASAKTRLPRGQSPWQNWLLSESIRRTIFMSYILILAITGFKYGYCSNWLFTESLPFDERAGLWMAESPQAWIAAAHVRSGREVGERLCSFHEFAEKVNRAETSFCGDIFMTLIAYGHNGGK